MNGILVKLKAILNGLSDEELKNYELWIDDSTGVELIAVDDNSIVLVTDKEKLKINNREW
jgi:hypothetical protein